MEYVFDDRVQLGSSEIYWRAWISGLLAAENRGPCNFAGLCHIQRSLQSNLPALLICQWVIPYRERSKGRLEKLSIDRVLLVKYDLWKRRHLEILELTNC